MVKGCPLQGEYISRCKNKKQVNEGNYFARKAVSMGIVLGFIGAIYIAARILKEEWGMGDFYRSVGMTKRGNESDSAVAGCILFFGFLIFCFIVGVCSS